MGTRFCATQEAPIHPNIKQFYVDNDESHNTLSNFRKDNIRCMKPLFREFNRFCLKMDMFKLDYVSIDGSKFRAVNSKDRNLTLSKLDDRLQRLDAHIEEYLAALEESDGEDCRRLSRA